MTTFPPNPNTRESNTVPGTTSAHPEACLEIRFSILNCTTKNCTLSRWIPGRFTMVTAPNIKISRFLRRAHTARTEERDHFLFLVKCRMLPDLKIEIRPMKEYENRQTAFSHLQTNDSVPLWPGLCQRAGSCCNEVHLCGSEIEKMILRQDAPEKKNIVRVPWAAAQRLPDR